VFREEEGFGPIDRGDAKTICLRAAWPVGFVAGVVKGVFTATSSDEEDGSDENY
jgi:hypothetical protein